MRICSVLHWFYSKWEHLRCSRCRLWPQSSALSWVWLNFLVVAVCHAEAANHTSLQRASYTLLHNLTSHSGACYVYYMTPPSHKSPHNPAGLQHSIIFGAGEALPIGSAGSKEFGWPILNATNKRLDQSSSKGCLLFSCLFVFLNKAFSPFKMFTMCSFPRHSSLPCETFHLTCQDDAMQ